MKRARKLKRHTRQIIWRPEYFRRKRGEFYLDKTDSLASIFRRFTSERGKKKGKMAFSLSLFVAGSSTRPRFCARQMYACRSHVITRSAERQDDTRGTHKARCAMSSGGGTPDGILMSGISSALSDFRSDALMPSKCT